MFTDFTFYLYTTKIWFPWWSLVNEMSFLQLTIFYFLYLIFVSSNLYYILFYMFVEIFFFGVFLCFINLDLFAAFLWLTEIVVILVCLFLTFNVNPTGLFKKYNQNILMYKYIYSIIIFFIVVVLNTSPLLSEVFLSHSLYDFVVWFDFYEASTNNKSNDLYGLYVSYSTYNCFEFIIVGLLLLIGSLVCVQLNRFLKQTKTTSYISFFDSFGFFKEVLNFLFLRKQNLTDQNLRNSSTKIVKKRADKEAANRKKKKKDEESNN